MSKAEEIILVVSILFIGGLGIALGMRISHTMTQKNIEKVCQKYAHENLSVEQCIITSNYIISGGKPHD